jgi:aspartate aminotransferase-like enzyme
MLWIPGPTEVRPEILAQLARPAIGHRSAQMVELIERLDPHLALAFGLSTNSTAELGVHSVSASGMMEASLRGVGQKILAVKNGAFAGRFATMAESLGKQVEHLEVEWGRGVDPAVLDETLTQKGPFDAVTLVSNETSTGTLTPLAPIAEVLARFPETMFLVDLVSLIAGAPVDFDANGIDFGFAGVQKALALPPGIAVFCASRRYEQAAQKVPCRGWHLDPLKLLAGHKQRKTPATPCTPLYYALAQQLEDISSGLDLAPGQGSSSPAKAWAARFDKHESMRSQTEAWATGHGLSLFPATGFRSPTVSCINAGEIDVGALQADLSRRGYLISNGYGDLKGRTFRIGHMGDHTPAGLAELLSAADDAISSPARS